MTENDFQLAPCMRPGDESCAIYSPCVLRSALKRASEAFLDELDRWTLADLIQKRTSLLIALNGPASGR